MSANSTARHPGAAPPASGPIIWMDAEVHLLHPDNRRRGWRPPGTETCMLGSIFDHPEGELALARAGEQELLAEMARAGIDQACLMGMPWMDPQRCRLDDAYIAGLVAANPERFFGFGVLADPRREDPLEQVRRMAREHGLLGVKVIPSWQGWKLTDAAMAPALGLMEELGLVLVPHTDHLVSDPARSDTAHALLETARRFPALKILAPHLGGLLCLYAMVPDVGPHLANMLFVTSVSRSMQMTTFAVQAVGAKRVVFGTDYPFNKEHDQGSVRQGLLDLGLPEDDLRGIAGDNLRGFLGLGPLRA